MSTYCVVYYSDRRSHLLYSYLLDTQTHVRVEFTTRKEANPEQWRKELEKV